MAGTKVQYRTYEDAPGTHATSDAEGKFTLKIRPGHGALLVRAPSPDDIKQEVTSREIYFGDRGGFREWPDGFLVLDTKPQAADMEVTVLLRRGVTVQGRALGADGKPLAKGTLITSTHQSRMEQPCLGASLILTPGVSSRYVETKELICDEWHMENVDGRRHQNLRTDADGGIPYPTLIPGAEYRIMALNQVQTGTDKRDSVVQPGETIDLGTIVAERR